MPVVLTEAVAGNELLHEPPLIASVRVRVPPAHSVGDAGDNAAGPVVIVISLVT